MNLIIAQSIICSDLLQSETELDIDFQITNLPSVQLAEAIITGFDDSERFNAKTILIAGLRILEMNQE